ncbi:MAG: S8 family peptidase [Bdellovibrionia bacterium]
MMSSKKYALLLAGSGLVFFVGLGAYVSYFEEDHNGVQRSQNSSERHQADGRSLEDSKITSKTKKVSDEPSALFNDPAINQAWGLKKADAARAWSVTKGSREIVVAVIDTGIDVKHEDIKNNLWKNPGETGKDSSGRDKSSNGIDDDGNGFIDDVYGWNFVSNNHKLDDNHGHGTHIAGIIGAEAGNGVGIIGIAPEVSLMILKYYDPKVPNTDNLKNTVQAIRYAVKMGAHIINYSGGGTEFSKEEFTAIAEAEKQGILFVAAAGNERSNSDQHHYYPADYELTNIISVTAVDPSTEVLPSSNYGVETVDIAAPGQNILSLLPGSTYGYMTGTSQATAFVSGAAALVMAHKQAYKADDVRKYILQTGDAFQQLMSKTKTARKLNLYKALTVLDQGVGATGVIAVNTVNMKNNFANDPNDKPSGSSEQMTSFGRSLLDAIQKDRDTLGTQQDEEVQ